MMCSRLELEIYLTCLLRPQCFYISDLIGGVGMTDGGDVKGPV